MIQHKLPELPYTYDALEPYISSETLEYHHDKHHASYVEKLNKLIIGSDYESASLEEIILQATGGIFNAGAQAWNHTFYWNCMSPTGGGKPKGELAKHILESFDSFEAFKDAFSTAAVTNFGSGWTWLTRSPDGRLEIVNTSDAGNPMTEGNPPLLTCDVWEHAYYLDYRNARAKYVDAFWQLINWDFVASKFAELQDNQYTWIPERVLEYNQAPESLYKSPVSLAG